MKRYRPERGRLAFVHQARGWRRRDDLRSFQENRPFRLFARCWWPSRNEDESFDARFKERRRTTHFVRCEEVLYGSVSCVSSLRMEKISRRGSLRVSLARSYFRPIRMRLGRAKLQ